MINKIKLIVYENKRKSNYIQIHKKLIFLKTDF
jgi:hypothetical protein